MCGNARLAQFTQFSRNPDLVYPVTLGLAPRLPNSQVDSSSWSAGLVFRRFPSFVGAARLGRRPGNWAYVHRAEPERRGSGV